MSTQFAVDLVFKSKGLDGIRDFRRSTTELEKNAKKAQGTLDKAGNSGQKAGRKIKRSIDRATASVSKFSKRLGGLRTQLLGLGVGVGISKAFGDASNLENLAARVRVLGNEYKQLVGIEKIAEQSAKRFRVANSEALAAYIDLGNRVGEIGYDLQDLRNIYEGLNTVLVKNKASAQEAASATLQLNQALGAGRLAGEEFRAVNEAAPQVISEVGRVLGVTRGEVKELAAEGKVSAAVLIKALTNLNQQGVSQLEENFTGAFGAQREFNKALKEFSEVVGTELLPVLTPLLQRTTELLKAFGQLPGPIKAASVGFTLLGAAVILVAPPLAALAGGVASFAPAAVAAGGAAKVLAGSLVILKGAMLALPWVALAAGATAATIATVNYFREADRTNRLIRDGAGSTDQLKGKQDELKEALEKAQNKLNGVGGEMKANAREAVLLMAEIKKLKQQLELLEGTYKIRLELEKRGFEFGADGNLSSYEVGGVKYDAKTRAAINPKETVSQKLERLGTAPWLDKLDTGTEDESGSAADKLKQQLDAGKELSREFEQQKKLLMAKNELQKQLLQNEFDRLAAVKQIQDSAAATQQADLIKQANEVAGLQRAKIIADYAKDELATTLEVLEASRLMIEADRRRQELIDQGINPALADSLVQIEQQFDAERNQLTALEGILTAELARVDANSAIAKELQKQLDKIKEIQGELDKAEEDEKDKAKKDNPGKIEEYMKKLENELNDFEGMVVSLAQTIESEFASAMSSAITGLIDGTTTAEEAFANMFRNIGKAFIDMATQMIAKALVMKALGILFPGAGGGGGGGGLTGSSGGWTLPEAAVPKTAGMSFFAEGGYVTGPTDAMVGEGGQSEYIIPAKDMDAAMSRYSSGKRGNEVINGTGAYDAEGGVAVAEAPISITTGPVMQFEGKNYVTQDEFARGVKSAAKQGEERALRKLQNSPGQRRRLGMR